MTKKYISIITFIIAMAFGLCGCNKEKEETGETSNTKIELETDEDEVIEMTDEEKNILCSVYVNEDRINEGKLYDYQLEALMQFRYAKEYLQKKYPGYEYNFYAFYPADISNPLTTLEFTVDNTEHYFSVEVHSTDEGYMAKDDLFTYILRPEFDAMMEKRLADAGIENCMVYTKMSGRFGEEIDDNTTVEEIVDMGRDIKIDFDIYIDMEITEDGQAEEVVEIIEEEMISMNNYGAHFVYFESGISSECSNSEECLEYRKTHYDMYNISFNTFD